MSDAIDAQLGVFAVPATPAKPANRTSRFWFQLPPKTAELKEKVKKRTPPVAVDDSVNSRVVNYKEELPTVLDTRITLVREFFLTEIAPLTLSASAGALQALDVAERTLDLEMDHGLYDRFNIMVNKAATLKLSAFVATLFELSPEQASMLLGRPNQGSSDDALVTSLIKDMQALSNRETRTELKSLKQGFSKIVKALDERHTP